MSINKDEVNQIYVTAKSPELVDTARSQIVDVLGKRHDVAAEGAFRIRDLTEVSKVMDQVVGGLSGAWAS